MLRKRFGDLLVENGVISREELEQILTSHTEKGVRLGEQLVRQGVTTEQDIAQTLASQLSLPYYPLDSEILDPNIVKLIPRSLAERYGVLAVSLEGNTILVAMIDPLDVRAFDTLRAQIKYQIRPAVAPKNAVRRCIGMYYDMSSMLDETISRASQERQDRDLDVKILDDEQEEHTSEGGVEVAAPVVVMVNTIFQRAVESGASDIHIEPEEEETQVRFRTDGMLRKVLALPKNLHDAIVSRIKIMSHLDISERRKPQDGRAKMIVLGRTIDFRISCLPTLLAEKVVIRILDKEQAVRSLDELGMAPYERSRFESSLHRTRGVILVTGPTGSGKTTTLYAGLQRVKTETKNLITVEDPVEYRLMGTNQVQINTRAGVTFASGLRSILRQDPDIIMVGEIRDKETAEIAIQAALTGHLVLSTLHTNDAPSAVTRLVDMGIEPFLLSATVICAVAQRLVRNICPHCKKEYQPSADVLKSLGVSTTEQKIFYRGEGCPQCRNSGYRGRTAIFEVMSVDDDLRDRIASRSSVAELTQAARRSGMRPLLVTGLEKAFSGVTTVEEVLRLTEGASEELPFCPNCLESVSPDYLVCPHCANHLKQPQAACLQCHRELKNAWKACPYCGTLTGFERS